MDWLVRDLYLCPNVRIEMTDVYINAGPARPFRAPGHPQGAWALEQMLDALAEAIKMDPVELRLKNIPTYSQAREGNPPYTTTGLKDAWRKGQRPSDGKRREKRQAPRHGRRPSSPGGGDGELPLVRGRRRSAFHRHRQTLFRRQRESQHGRQRHRDRDQNRHGHGRRRRAGRQAAKIQIEHADTGTTQYATPSGGSKTVPTESPAVRAAAIEVKQQLLDMAAEELKVGSFGPDDRRRGSLLEPTIRRRGQDHRICRGSRSAG